MEETVDVAVVTVTDTEVLAELVAVERTVALAVLDTVVLAVALADELTEEDADVVAVVETVDVWDVTAQLRQRDGQSMLTLTSSSSPVAVGNSNSSSQSDVLKTVQSEGSATPLQLVPVVVTVLLAVVDAVDETVVLKQAPHWAGQNVVRLILPK